MKTQGTKLLRDGLVDSLDQIRQGLLSHPLGIKFVIIHISVAIRDGEITLKDLKTSKQELLDLHDLVCECLNEENPEKSCQVKLRKIYPETNTMIAQA
ncbi:hypothetical protein HOB10_05670 [Candidatus Parcubacteria bacterium]|jgi:hypothetical protein|nr:hypothetical protein [bacterium]MBT6691786.1 hypothetical protein [Candidatus Parcubacteria bacterium]